jgi:hypothetical protein
VSEEDKVIHVSDRLRDGREVKTDEDHQQWIYFDNISRNFGLDMTPIQVFPPMTRVMVEWVEAISGMSGEIDQETAQTLTDSMSELSDCLRRLLHRSLPVPDRS